MKSHKFNYSKYLVGDTNPASSSAISDIEIAYSVDLHESHKDFLLSADGGMCRSDDPKFDKLLFLTTNKQSPSFLGSIICENRFGLNIPIADATDQNLLYVDQSNGCIRFGGLAVADSLENFFIGFCKLIKTD